MEWIVTAEESGSKLIDFLKKRFAFSARHIKRAIEQSSCQVNGVTERFASAPLGRGDRVAFAEPAVEPVAVEDETRLLYEDSAFLFYNKPAGIASDDAHLLKRLRQKNPLLQLVHRLDKETTGVLLFAKSPEVFESMVQLFKEKQVAKEYLALVDGVPAKKSGVIENQLGKIATFEGQTIWGKVARGLPARTEWQVEKAGDQVALLRCFPITGRTHQLRVHLSEMGHPILGDSQYGRRFRSPLRPRRSLLHAEKLAFIHPGTGVPLLVEAPLPKDFSEAIGSMRSTTPP